MGGGLDVAGRVSLDLGDEGLGGGFVEFVEF